MGSYVRTAALNDTTALLLKKMDEVIAAMSGGDIVASYNTLQGSYASLVSAYNTLQGDFASLVSAYNTLQGSYATVIGQLATEAALVNGPYVDGTATTTDSSAAAVDGTSAATGAIGAVPTTAASELM